MKLSSLVVALALGLSGAAAHAVTLQYTLTGTDLDGTVEYASFQMDSDPVILPANVGMGEGFRVKFLSGVFQYGEVALALQDIQFFNGDLGGGFISLEPTDTTGATTFLNIAGPQLYTGSEANPTMLTGNFSVYDFASGAPLALTVAEAAAVPEAATWAMLTIGFGAVGAAMRGRRPVTVVTG